MECRPKDPKLPSITRTATSSPYHQKVFELLGATPLSSATCTPYPRKATDGGVFASILIKASGALLLAPGAAAPQAEVIRR